MSLHMAIIKALAVVGATAAFVTHYPAPVLSSDIAVKPSDGWLTKNAFHSCEIERAYSYGDRFVHLFIGHGHVYIERTAELLGGSPTQIIQEVLVNNEHHTAIVSESFNGTRSIAFTSSDVLALESVADAIMSNTLLIDIEGKGTQVHLDTAGVVDALKAIPETCPVR